MPLARSDSYSLRPLLTHAARSARPMASRQVRGSLPLLSFSALETAPITTLLRAPNVGAMGLPAAMFSSALAEGVHSRLARDTTIAPPTSSVSASSSVSLPSL